MRGERDCVVLSEKGIGHGLERERETEREEDVNGGEATLMTDGERERHTQRPSFVLAVSQSSCNFGQLWSQS
jgi:hypothetical protein